MTVTEPANPRWWQRRWLRAVVVAVALGAWPACNRHAEEMDGHEPAPMDFVLQDINGQDVRLSDFRGKPVVVNFWATWCGPCKTEVPWFVQFTEKYKAQNLTILGVSVDDPVDDIRAFAEQYNVNYPMLVGLGHDDVAKAYDALYAIPVTWLIRPDGTVHSRVSGINSEDWFDAKIQELF